MIDLASRVHRALQAAGIVNTGVSIGDDTDRSTWRVSPASQQAAAQPIIDAFVLPTAAELADEEATREADLRILKAMAVEFYQLVPPYAGKPTMLQFRAAIIARYKTL